ncbi:transketolase [Gordoniibacillus kamchatkensis]|uniref:Transketolase n=1 Tax=Gordoniibacillus kamchatkensis TaxID=1590651 RepID=A0ABR5AEQ1_9BACL|nr:transketolase [Paenibacillus sp. VKM B-2647]KIL39538.1 transketolase [Paenibacillus sp. VKM B-2647]
MAITNQSIDQLAINTIRTLAIDAIDKANSGHPGIVMGAAPMAYSLWTQHMTHNPANPHWINRDRFVLSAGHGSMLLYALLHLCGYDLPLEEIKNFRQWGSLTPGHPEYGHTAGVDATTGPLGQGVGMAVGMAMAEAHLAATYNKEGFNVIDHHTYVLCGDGDMMEGVASEAASLAGHLRLGKLIMLYDSNDISLDGDLDMSFSEDVRHRFEAYGWQVLRVDNGNDLTAISTALSEAKADKSRPTLIEVKTVIGYGSPNKAGKGGHAGPHGSPLGKEETMLTKEAYGWPTEPDFLVPDEVRAEYAKVKERGAAAEKAWNELVARYEQAHPELAKQLRVAASGELPQGWDAELPVYAPTDKAIATRAASGAAINAIAKKVPYLFGGSADLLSSNNTEMKGLGNFSRNDYASRNIWFGVREFAMGTALNGMSLHGGLRVFGGTFFVFSDYLRPSIRLAALMKQPVIYVFTHDSIAVGEDGPTHEPIEQLPALRTMPGVTVLRPADANETSQAWRYAMEHQDTPYALILTRQNLPILEGTAELAKEGVRKGAYVISDAANGQPVAQILASGSEVQLAVAAQKQLAAEGIHVRVVSMPSLELFEKQPQSYKDSVILPNVRARLAVEMANPMSWYKYVGLDGDVLGIDKFGASAPAGRILPEYGFTVENVAARVKALLK